MKARIAYVRWQDCIKFDGQYATADIPAIPVIETVGWLVERSELSVTLAVERNRADGLWRDVIRIPAVNVLELRTARVKGLKPRRVCDE